MQSNGRQARLFGSFLPIPQRHIIGRDHNASGLEEKLALLGLAGVVTPHHPEHAKTSSQQDRPASYDAKGIFAFHHTRLRLSSGNGDSMNLAVARATASP